jgi:cobalt-zinc-cadmium efflux system outer membrane protein
MLYLVSTAALKRSVTCIFCISKLLFIFTISFLSLSFSVNAAESFTLESILAVATTQNPLMKAAQAREEAASAQVVTSRTFGNPQLEIGAGPSRYRTPGVGGNANWGAAISQPLDFPDVRAARRNVAEYQVEVATIGIELAKIDLRTRVKSAFYDVLQRQAILKLAEDNRNLLKDIRGRVKLRVDVGESPKYELIKSDTELLAAERDFQSASVRVLEGKAYLKGLVGDFIPSDFQLIGELPMKETLPSITQLREKIDNTAQLKQVKAAINSSEANLKLQKALINPGIIVRLGIEQDPDLRQLRLGVQIPIPMWDQRRGQISQASAEVSEVNAILNDRELVIKRDIEAAYNRYMIAQGQLSAFEDGLLAQADAVLKVAEASYRFGERGILDYLDAQRTQRGVRKDYLVARFEYVNTMLEIERLLGFEFLEKTQ